jgi:hypothetical protein
MVLAVGKESTGNPKPLRISRQLDLSLHGLMRLGCGGREFRSCTTAVVEEKSRNFRAFSRDVLHLNL